MENTRQTILDILRRRKSATVDGLTHELGLAPATVRRHLDILMRDGHIDVQQVRRETGRPHYLFSLSDAGEDLFPKHYVSLANRVFESLSDMNEQEISGRDGREVLDIVLARMADTASQQYSPRIAGDTVDERVGQVVRALRDEGILLSVEKTDEGWVLVGQGCPNRRVRESHAQVCLFHRRLIANLIGSEMEFTGPGANSDTYCTYRIRSA